LRWSSDTTLNFIIPAEKMFAFLHIEAQVTDAGAGTQVTSSIQVSVTLQQTLKLRAIMIAFDGPSPDDPARQLSVPPPTLAHLQTTAAWTVLVYPVQSEATFEVATTKTLATPLRGYAATADDNAGSDWANLFTSLNMANIADGNRPGYIYYGLIPTGFPREGSVLGQASGRVCAGSVGDYITMAHEIGHVCNRLHAPCGPVGSTVDPNYPLYPPYSTNGIAWASIGEYGLDISTGYVQPPAAVNDFMGYCRTDCWVSLYTYAALNNNSALNPKWLGDKLSNVAYQRFGRLWPPPPNPKWWWPGPGPDPPEPEPVDWQFVMHNVIALTGVLTSENLVSITHVARTKVFSSAIDGTRTDMIAELEDANHEVLAAAPVFNMPMSSSVAASTTKVMAGASGALGLLQAFIPDVAPGARLIVRNAKKRLWQRRAPSRPVAIGKLAVAESKDDKIEITWKATWSHGAVRDIWVRYSADKGHTWKSIVTEPTGDRAVIEANHLPIGDLLLEVVAPDGFYSSRSEPITFDNQERLPEPAILHPVPGRPLIAGTTLYLCASVALQTGHHRARLRFSWTIDERDAGEGLQLSAEVPAPGRHRVMFTVSDQGRQTSRKVLVEFTSIRTRTSTGPPIGYAR